jgi:hypothetical protein
MTDKPEYINTREGGLFWRKPTANGGPILTRLSTFSAKIVAEVTRDDGAEVTRLFEMEAWQQERHRRFTLPVERFPAVEVWALQELGAKAIVLPGYTPRAKVAIQSLSEGAVERRVFAQTGWRQLPDASWVYLHAGGAVGNDGAVPGVEVELPSNLSGFALPDPPGGEELVQSIQASLRLLDVAPDRVTVPLLGAVYRAPMGPVDLAVWLAGRTGVYKSELAARAQQHWGPRLERERLPANWSSTGNALEEVAFTAADALLVIDDFAPEGTGVDRGRLYGTAARLLRAQGNSSGRARLRPDGTPRPVRPPRGLVVSTGEDVPRGHSVLARFPIVEVGPGDVDLDRLTVAQVDGAAGRFAQAMSGFVRWLARRRGGLVAWRRDQVAELRRRFHGPHARTASEVAELAVGWQVYLQYAEESGAITTAEHEELWRRVLAAFQVLTAAQAEHLRAVDPVDRFVELISSGLVSGRCHIARIDGTAPSPPRSLWLAGRRLRGRGAGREDRMDRGEPPLSRPSDGAGGRAGRPGSRR